MGIRIDALNPAVSAEDDHEFPAIRGGVTVRLTAAQISAKVQSDPWFDDQNADGSKLVGLADGTDGGDAVNKSQLDGINADLASKYAVKTANYTAVDADTNTSIRFTSAATLAFGVSANLRTNWRIEVWNDSTGNVVLDPNSTDTINGTGTLVLQPRQRAEIFKTGATAFQASIFGDQLSGPQLQGYIFGIGMSTNATDAANDVDIATGAAGSDTSPYYLMQLTSALTKRIDAAWAVGNNKGGLDTGSVTNATYYLWLIQRSDTLVTDALFSLSSTAPTMPANYDRKRIIGIVTRASGVNQYPDSTNISPLIHVRDQKTSGSTGGASVVGLQTRTLNTVAENGIPGASLSSNQITLPSGKYEISASAPANSISNHQAALVTSGGSVIVVGTSEATGGSAVAATTRSFMKGRFSLSATTSIQISHFIAGASPGAYALGVPASSGRPEIYTDVMIWKVD